MKYELRRLGEAVQYATAIAPYGSFLFIVGAGSLTPMVVKPIVLTQHRA